MKLKVLLSAYACEPMKGSEPEVGWQWAMQMARFHDVTVLTRSNNRENIERGLAALPQGTPVPTFIYFDCTGWAIWLKSRFRMPQFYYIIWQKSAWHLIAELNKVAHFDLLHHITFAGYRYTTAIWDQGVPCIWGPVGGMEAMPFHLLPWRHLSTICFELLRNANNALQSMPFHVIPGRAASSTAILVSTHETAKIFKDLGVEVQTMATIGIGKEAISDRPLVRPEGPLKILFVGGIIAIKGVELAILALKKARADATLTFVGNGNYLQSAQALVRKLQLSDRVHFLGRRPREEVMQIYPSYHVFLFPSFHDSGGFVVIEAMAQGLPVICLDCGGPALSVTEDCGFRVPQGNREEVVKGMAKAIEFYDQNREKVVEHGMAARRAVAQNYDWDRKGEQMSQVYSEAYQKGQLPGEPWKDPQVLKRIARQGRLFSTLGILMILAIFILVTFVQLWTMRELKQQANKIVYDTLPGVVYAGAANETRNRGFIDTLLLLTRVNAENDERYLQEMHAFGQKTTYNLDAYKACIYEPEDARNYEALIAARTKYLEVHTEAKKLIGNGDQQEVARLLSEKLLPAYLKYDHLGQKLMEYNINQSRQRSLTIMKMYRITEIALVLEAVAIFVIGFAIGFFKK